MTELDPEAQATALRDTVIARVNYIRSKKRLPLIKFAAHSRYTASGLQVVLYPGIIIDRFGPEPDSDVLVLGPGRLCRVGVTQIGENFLPNFFDLNQALQLISLNGEPSWASHGKIALDLLAQIVMPDTPAPVLAKDDPEYPEYLRLKVKFEGSGPS